MTQNLFSRKKIIILLIRPCAVSVSVISAVEEISKDPVLWVLESKCTINCLKML